MTLNDSWDKLPEAKVRLTGDNQLQALIDGLGKNGLMSFYKATVNLDDQSQGIYISIAISAGKYPDILPVSIDVFVPVPKAMMPKPGKTLEEINADYKKEIDSIKASSAADITIADDRTIHELKSAQMDVVGDIGRSGGDSGNVGSGISSESELSEGDSVGEATRPEV